MRLAWQTRMFAKVVFCQEQITAGALTANEGGRLSHRNHSSYKTTKRPNLKQPKIEERGF